MVVQVAWVEAEALEVGVMAGVEVVGRVGVRVGGDLAAVGWDRGHCSTGCRPMAPFLSGRIALSLVR